MMKTKYYRFSLAIALLIGLTAYSAPTHNIQSSNAVAASDSQTEKTILIWNIGDPNTENLPNTNIPAELKKRAEQLNYKLAVEAVSARSVTAKLRAAIKENRQPDIIAYRNHGVIVGMETDSEKLAGIYSIDGVKKSSVFVNNTLRSLNANAFLFDTSANYDIARQLASPEIECKNTAETKSLSNVDLDAIENFALDYTQALFSNSPGKLKNYQSKSAIVGRSEANLKGMPLTDMKICSTVANRNLAAVSTVVAHDGSGNVGHLDLLMILRKEEEDWQLLTQQLGNINEDASPYIDKLAKAIADSEPEKAPPSPATNLSSQNVKPKPVEGERFEDFTWQPSQSDNVVAEIVEFSHGVDARLFVKLKGDRKEDQDSISAGGLYHTDGGKWHWRVWSISTDGSIAFSETQTFQDEQAIK